MSQGYLFQALDPNGVPSDLQCDATVPDNLYLAGRVGANSHGQGYIALALNPSGVPTALRVDANGNLQTVSH